MPLPAGIATVTITGTLYDANGIPAAGSIEFTPSVPVLHAGADTIVLPTTISTPITSGGVFSVVLPACDDTAGNPTGWTYRVTERVNGGASYSISVLTANGTTQDLSALAPVASDSGVAVVVGPAGPAITDASLLVSGTVADARLPVTAQAATLSSTYVPGTRETAGRQTYRAATSTAPADLGSLLTPSVYPYDLSDGLTAAVGFDRAWLITGEDGQCHVLSKMDLSTYRADREPDWTAAHPWSVAMNKVTSDPTNLVTPNSFLQGSAQETWTFQDAGINMPVTTGYALVGGTGDKNGATYRPPTVMFWRDGTPAMQSLTKMLDDAGIMGGVYTTPRCLMGISRVSADTFYLSGSGENQSTNPDASRPTFGLMVLTLDAAKTETTPIAVTSLTWTDYLPVLQAVMPGGETIVNVPAVADALSGTTLYVLAVTKDGGGVRRARLVKFDNAAHTAALDTLLANGGATIWPITPQATDTEQQATITVGATGILWAIVGVAVPQVFYRATAETTWRNVVNQTSRAIGYVGAPVIKVDWDAGRSRYTVAGSGGGGVGWLDAACKQGHPYTSALPARSRTPGDSVGRLVKSLCTDASGILAVGARQLAMLIPPREQSPSRVLWGLRVSPTAVADQVTISEGEALIYDAQGNFVRVYGAGGQVLGGVNGTGYSCTIGLSLAGVLGHGGGTYSSGLDYPDPAVANQAMLAVVLRTSTGVVITPAEITQTGASRDGMVYA